MKKHNFKSDFVCCECGTGDIYYFVNKKHYCREHFDALTPGYQFTGIPFIDKCRTYACQSRVIYIVISAKNTH